MLKWFRWILLPLGVLHLTAIQLRHIAYRFGFFKRRYLPVPVISVGNIQAGGTGKTPFVILLLQQLQESGLRVGILSRGYGRQSEGILTFTTNGEQQPTATTAGDEPIEIWPHITAGGMGIGADRYEAGMTLLETCQLDCILLDDGLQHQRLGRDLDICLIDVSSWQFHPFLLPFSYLRDIKNKLRDVDWIILNKWEAQPHKLTQIEPELASYPANIKRARFTFADITNLYGEKIKEKPMRVGMICGIANPQYFADMLSGAGYEIVWQKHFADHHSYTNSELLDVLELAKTAGAEQLITTEKDAVKIRPLLAGKSEQNKHFAIANLKIEVADDRKLLQQIISIVGKSRSQ
ncbi:MAG: tetraacyldisaccharide 4'-kinase [Calditrichia bacterium]